MLRLATGAAAGENAGVGCDCNNLPAGHICGVPIKCSIFMLVYCFYSAVGLKGSGAPWWVILGMVLGSLAILAGTILVHEFGHGLTARRLGGHIHHIHLGVLGGLCFCSMPPHGTKKEKLSNDWWVTHNGPVTHLAMTPAWIGVLALAFLAFGSSYTWQDIWWDVNPFDHVSSLSRHHEVRRHGWGAVLLLHLCAAAISMNVVLFLFNLLFPMYPLDSSKLLVTGMQLCGVPVQKAARRFVWISGLCCLLLTGLAVWQVLQWIRHAKPQDYHQAVQMVGMGFIPIPFHIVLEAGLAAWGGRQTWEIYQLLDSKSLHTHPLFNHVSRTSRTVRDLANGRPDRFVDQWIDVYDDDEPPAPPPAARPQSYGAVRMVDGQIVRG